MMLGQCWSGHRHMYGVGAALQPRSLFILENILMKIDCLEYVLFFNGLI